MLRVPLITGLPAHTAGLTSTPSIDSKRGMVSVARYPRMRPTHHKYFQSEARSLTTNCQNDRAVIVSAGIPEYVSMRQRK